MTTGPALMPLDHLVIAVHDLEQAMQRHRDMGFRVQVGGKHPGRLSHNALVVFEDGSYFELIAWSADAPAEAWWHILQQQGEGLIGPGSGFAHTGSAGGRSAATRRATIALDHSAAIQS